MKDPRTSFSIGGLKTLMEKYNVDVDDNNSLKQFEAASIEALTKLRDLQRMLESDLHPNRKKIVPRGPECSFCRKAENEVKTMVQHKQGSICAANASR